MKKKAPLYKIPLATAHKGNKILLFSKLTNSDESELIFNTSSDGLSFSGRNTKVEIFNKRKKIEINSIFSIKIFSPISSVGIYTMTFEMATLDGQVEIFTASSRTLNKWTVFGYPIPVPFAKQATLVPKGKNRPHNIVYFSDREIWTAIKHGIKEWHNRHIVINPRLDSFDSQPLEAIAFIPEEQGLFILYTSQAFSGNSVDMEIGGLICSYKDPSKVIWRSKSSLWHGHFEKAEYLVPIGGEMFKKHIFLYWMGVNNELIVVKLERLGPNLFTETKIEKIKGPLKRWESNPIISPRSDHDWEVDGTFNPAAFKDEQGVIHLLYRAIGKDGISRIGYAKSDDGVHFIARSSFPVYEAMSKYKLQSHSHVRSPAEYSTLSFFCENE